MKEEQKKQWLEKLRKHEAFCYIKPNNKKHDSGFGCFEVGYLTVENARMKEKLVLGEYSDHIHLYEIFQKRETMMLNIDLLLDGYIRFHARDILAWENGAINWVISSVELTLLE